MAETIDAPLVKVELFEDRAAVTRRVTLTEPGRHHLRIGPLTPLLNERALSFPGGTTATVEEVGVERVRVTRQQADPEAMRALQIEHRTHEERVARSAAALQRSREHAHRMRASIDALLAASPRALVESDAGRWVALVQTIATDRVQADEQLAEMQLDYERCTEELAALERRLAAARSGRHVLQGFLVLGLWAEQPTTFLVRYVVPCALWRPAHRAELVRQQTDNEQDGKYAEVLWTIGAVCWNATGEDWRDVELVCSTARPGDLAHPPALLDDLLDTTRKQEREIVVEARDVTIQVSREQDGQTTASAPGVDDGGEPRTFVAPHAVTLPSNGRPVAIDLDTWRSEALPRWLSLPERSSAAVLRSVQRNRGSRPLLAGPVSLIREGLSIGRGKIPLVASGETFPLGWGSHDGLRITRRRDHKVERTPITGHQRHEFTIEIRVVHLGSEPCTLEVRERIPVSELGEVTVSVPKTDPALDGPVDRDGFVRWTLSLTPGEQRTLSLFYAVDASSKVRLPF